jgi:hypothetical protein
MRFDRLIKWSLSGGIFALVLSCTTACTKYADPEPVFEEYVEDEQNKIRRKVLVVSIDGAVGTEVEKAMPSTIASLIEQGKYTWNGISEAKSNDATTWASMLTGVGSAKHLIEDESFRAAPDPSDPHSIPEFYPTFLYRLMEVRPEYNTVVISPWSSLVNTLMIEAETRIVSSNDLATKDSTVAHIQNEDPEVMFVNFRGVLDAGLESGFSVENSKYLNALNTVDGYLGEIMSALESRENYETEEWLVVVTSNHGGTGKAFGGGSLSERNIFAIYHYKDFEPLELIPSFIEAPEFYQSGSNNNYTAPVFEAASAADYDYDGSEMTVEFRYKRNVRHPWVGEPMIIGKTGRTSLQTAGPGWGISTRNNFLVFYARLENGTDITHNFTTDIDDFQWHHYAVSFQVRGTDFTLRLYNDGKLAAEATYQVSNANAARIVSTAPFFVGVRNSHNAGVLSQENGNFGEIRIYDKALTNEEVMNAACLPFLDEESQNYGDLTAYWRLNVKENNAFPNELADKPSLVAKNTLPQFFQMSSLLTPCNIEDERNVIVGNIDLLPQLYYWLNIDTKADWGLDGKVFLNKYEIEFVN